MSKGARNREKNAVEIQQKKEITVKENKKKKTYKLITIVTAVVLVAAIGIFGSIYGFYYANGEYLRKNVSATSETQKVDNAMMTYYLNQTLENYKTYYGDYFSMITGIDTAKSLKNQTYSVDQSWFDYLLTSTKDAVKELMVLSDAANEAGFTLSEEQKTSIAERAETVDLSAYNNKLNKEDYIRCTELTALATMYKNQLLSEMSVSDDEINTYYTENENTFKNVSYRKFTFSYSDAEDSTLPKAEEAKLIATDIQSSANEEEFISKITEQIKRIYPDITDEDLQTRLSSTVNAAVAYTAGDEISEWAFSADRKVGDTYSYSPEGGASFDVYYLTAVAARDESVTASAGHILFTSATYGSDDAAKAKAEEVLAQFESGDKSVDSFKSLAFKYTEDTGSQYNGGIYENTKQGQMVTEFDNWIFDAARKTGDTEIVKTSYGYHIMYYIEGGKQAWQAQVADTIKNNKYTEDYTALSEKYAVTFDDSKLSDIPA